MYKKAHQTRKLLLPHVSCIRFLEPRVSVVFTTDHKPMYVSIRELLRKA